MRKILLSLLSLAIIPASSQASTMTYKFLIPSFGGDPNYFYVFKSEADVQNIYHAPEKPRKPVSAVEDFKRKLQYMVLNKLADKIVAAAFGESETVPSGSYTVGDYQISIQPSDNEIQVHLTDITTGVTTTVVVPKYNF